MLKVLYLLKSEEFTGWNFQLLCSKFHRNQAQGSEIVTDSIQPLVQVPLKGFNVLARGEVWIVEDVG